ncbi:methyltransferase family protein [Ureibacillus xyleni]|uniref:Methyltransferase family protein n=1 Tax=Ureibacillus xyleni TaxID=614648 RepID=A0A285SSI3_9BACL|nr:class I SAM-dependent methyltransferase [Ureibacillus xyleni]SOC11309.1 methyltransferase family protein [Ureibacillus xyleni]
MKNITDTRPDLELHGRLLYTVQYVDNENIKGKDVLDIGCGYGWFELYALKNGVNKIIGIEITDEDLSTARKYIHDKRAEFHTGSGIEIPFDNVSFDTVVSWEVIEHIPKNTEKNMFLEVNRVLKDNGIFYLSTPFRSLPSTVFDPAWWLIGHRHYSKQTLTNLAEQFGFVVESIEVKGAWWEIAYLWNFYISKWAFRRTPFYDDYLNRKRNQEYSKEKGNFTIFIKMRKSSSI